MSRSSHAAAALRRLANEPASLARRLAFLPATMKGLGATRRLIGPGALGSRFALCIPTFASVPYQPRLPSDASLPGAASRGHCHPQ